MKILPPKHHADLFLLYHYPSLLGKSRPLTDDAIESLGLCKERIVRDIDALDCLYDHQVMIKISLFGYQSKAIIHHSAQNSPLSPTLKKGQDFTNLFPSVSVIDDEEDGKYPSYIDVMVDGLNYSFVIFDLETYVREEFERYMLNNSKDTPHSRFSKEDFNKFSDAEKELFFSHAANKEITKIMNDHKRITDYSTLWFYDVIEYECTPYFQLLIPEEDGLKNMSLNDLLLLMEQIVHDYEISHHNAKFSIVPYETVRFY